MPVNEKLLLHNLASTFNTLLNVELDDDTKSYIKANAKEFSKLATDEKIYYQQYSLHLVQQLVDYLGTIATFELNTDADHEIIHDFRLIPKKGETSHISMSHGSINIRDIIPEKLMKICKYKKNTNIAKSYLEGYGKISQSGYAKIKSTNKYSELSDKTKTKVLYKPFCELVTSTLAKKRKCTVNLYQHLFAESNRIILKLYKNRFVIYDFGIELENNVESFKMKSVADNKISVVFNNGLEFLLALQTNGTEIKEHLSLKFHTSLENMDEIFAVRTGTI